MSKVESIARAYSQERWSRFIRKLIRKYGEGPVKSKQMLDEIQEEFGVKRKTAIVYLAFLGKLGYVQRVPGRQLVKFTEKAVLEA